MNKSGRRSNVRSKTTGIVLILLLVVPTLAVADGMAFSYPPTSSLEPLAVNEQRAIIAHKDGIQRMFITINLGEPSSADEASRAAVRIFPVSGRLDRGDAEVTDFIPVMRGDNLEQAIRTAMPPALLIALYSQPHFLSIYLNSPGLPRLSILPYTRGHFGTSGVVISGIVLLVVLSSVSGGISGKLVFGKWKPWSRMGLWNCLTIAALVAATWWSSRRDPAPYSLKATVSARWEALVFGLLVCEPMGSLIGAFGHRIAPLPLPNVPSPQIATIQLLEWALIVAGLLIAGWIVSNPGSPLPAGRQLDHEPHRAPNHTGIKETAIRIMLMFGPAVVPFSISQAFIRHRLAGAFGRVTSGPDLLGIGWPIFLVGLIVLGLATTSWIVRKAGSIRPGERRAGLEAEWAVSGVHKPEAFILAGLTSIVAVLIVLSCLIPDYTSGHSFLLRVGWYGLIASVLLVATWLVWKGGTPSISSDTRTLPVWAIAIAGLLLLLAVCGILTGVAAELSDGGPTFKRQRGINITGMSLLPAICFLGVIILIGFLNRKRIDRFRRNMTNRDVLSVIFAVLGVFSYLAVFEYIAAVFARWSSVADALAALALLSATWLLKGEPQDRPTKALRFGVLFSVVFTLLNVATFLGLKALVGSL